MSCIPRHRLAAALLACVSFGWGAGQALPPSGQVVPERVVANAATAAPLAGASYRIFDDAVTLKGLIASGQNQSQAVAALLKAYGVDVTQIGHAPFSTRWPIFTARTLCRRLQEGPVHSSSPKGRR